MLKRTKEYIVINYFGELGRYNRQALHEVNFNKRHDLEMLTQDSQNSDEQCHCSVKTLTVQHYQKIHRQ